MDHMSITDLEDRYGPMVSLDTLAAFFHARVRALQSALRRQDIAVYEFGDDRVVALRAVEEKFDLGKLVVGDEAVAHGQAKWRATHRADGTVKPAEEYLDELRARTPDLIARIEAARQEQRERHVVAGR